MSADPPQEAARLGKPLDPPRPEDRARAAEQPPGGEPLRSALLRHLARAGFALTALAIVLLPWFALDDHTPNGWDATWWARLALVATLAGLILTQLDTAPRVRLALAAVATAAIAFRLAVPPEFGFGFDGLDVPTERRIGAPIALATAAAALLGEALRARRGGPAAGRPDSPRSGTAPEASASGPAGPAPA